MQSLSQVIYHAINIKRLTRKVRTRKVPGSNPVIGTAFTPVYSFVFLQLCGAKVLSQSFTVSVSHVRG